MSWKLPLPQTISRERDLSLAGASTDAWMCKHIANNSHKCVQQVWILTLTTTHASKYLATCRLTASQAFPWPAREKKCWSGENSWFVWPWMLHLLVHSLWHAPPLQKAVWTLPPILHLSSAELTNNIILPNTDLESLFVTLLLHGFSRHKTWGMLKSCSRRWSSKWDKVTEEFRRAAKGGRGPPEASQPCALTTASPPLTSCFIL